MNMPKFIFRLAASCLLFMAGIGLLYVWNYATGGWIPDWMVKFLVFEEVKRDVIYEATIRFNIIGMIYVLFTRGWFYLGITGVPLLIMNRLYEEELYSLTQAITFNIIWTAAMMIYPLVFEFPDYGQCYLVMYELAAIAAFLFASIAYKGFTQESPEFFQKEIQEGLREQMKDIYKSDATRMFIERVNEMFGEEEKNKR